MEPPQDEDLSGHVVPTKDTLISIANWNPHRTKVPLDKALAKLTHLPLNEKGYTRIRNLKQCTALRVLYLYDNRIERIEGLDFGSTLTHLYLQNNEIEVLENLPLKKLQKLYVEGNRISLVKGLDDCERLEELHINRQRLNPLGPGLQFDPMCMRHIANTLCVLKAQACGIRDEQLEMLAMLRHLEDCDLAGNQLAHVEYVQLLVSECSAMRALELRGNPLCRSSKYRNDIIIHSENLQQLDGKEVTPNEREFLLRLHMHKGKGKKKKAAAPAADGVDMAGTTAPQAMSLGPMHEDNDDWNG